MWAGQVGARDRAAGRSERARLSLGEVARIERLEPVVGDCRQRGRERRLADPLAGVPPPASTAIGREERRRRPDGRREPRRHPLDDVAEAGRCGHAVACQLDGRGEQRRARQAPEPGMRVGPRANRARHGDRQRAVERERGHPGRPQTGGVGGVGGGRRPARSVERDLRPGGGVPDQPERIAADPAAVRHDHGQDGVGRDRRVHRGPAGTQDSEARRRSRGGAARRPRRGCRARPGPAPTAGRPVTPAPLRRGRPCRRCRSRAPGCAAG